MRSAWGCKVAFPIPNWAVRQWWIPVPSEDDNPGDTPQIGLIHKGISAKFAALETGITACGRLIGTNAMRGKRCAGLRLLLLPAALLGAGAVAAKDAPIQAVASALPTTIIVLDVYVSVRSKLCVECTLVYVRLL